MTQRLWVFLVLGFLSVLAAHSAGFDLAQVESALIAERANLEASPPFLPAYLLNQLDGLSPQQLQQVVSKSSVDPEWIDRALRDVRTVKLIRKDWARRGVLPLDECRTAGGNGFKWELVDPEEPPLDLLAIAKRAYGVLLVRISEVQSGYSGTFSTRVVAEHIETLGSSPLAFKSGETISYYRGFYILTPDDAGPCIKPRSGFDIEHPGDLFLIFAAKPTGLRAPESLVPALFFPVKNGELILQPYEFLLREEPVSLEDLRSALSAETWRQKVLRLEVSGAGRILSMSPWKGRAPRVPVPGERVAAGSRSGKGAHRSGFTLTGLASPLSLVGWADPEDVEAKKRFGLLRSQE